MVRISISHLPPIPIDDFVVGRRKNQFLLLTATLYIQEK